MLNYENFAITLARAVELFRVRRDAIDEQKAALRALVALAKLGGATVRLDDRRLAVESTIIPSTLPGIKSLIAQMDLQGIEEVRISRNAAPADLLRMLRSLSAGVSAGLDAAAEERDLSGGVRVVRARPVAPEPGGRPQSVTAAFEAEGLAEREALAAATATTQRGSRLDSAIEALVLDPESVDAESRMATCVEEVERLVAVGDAAAAVGAVSQLVRLERDLPMGEAGDRFIAAFTRMLTGPFLVSAADLLADPEHADAALGVVQRGGPEAGDLLIERLAESGSPDERRNCLEALQGIDGGIRRALDLLSHPQVFVVRNVAEAVGALRLEPAVPALGRALTHEDPGVRRAVAVALARIGTAATVEHLRGALRERDEEIRSLVAGAVSGRQSAALARPLVLAAEDEPDREVQRDFYLALARIGTPEAIQALVKAAQPGGRFFRRRRPDARVAAIDGLRAAGGPAAVGTLEALRYDRNEQVRQAARAALEDLGES